MWWFSSLKLKYFFYVISPHEGYGELVAVRNGKRLVAIWDLVATMERVVEVSEVLVLDEHFWYFFFFLETRSCHCVDSPTLQQIAHLRLFDYHNRTCKLDIKVPGSLLHLALLLKNKPRILLYFCLFYNSKETRQQTLNILSFCRHLTDALFEEHPCKRRTHILDLSFQIDNAINGSRPQLSWLDIRDEDELIVGVPA